MPCRAIVLPVDLPQILERISRHHAHPFWVAYRKGVPTARGQYVVLPRETLPMIGFTRPQLQHAFRHAGDFGVVGNASNTTLAEFSAAIHQHVIAEGTRVIAGTYRNVPVTHFMDPHTGMTYPAASCEVSTPRWRTSIARQFGGVEALCILRKTVAKHLCHWGQSRSKLRGI